MAKKTMQFTDAATISSTEFLASATSNPVPIIEGIAESHILTPEFVDRFYRHITPEMFMRSFRLQRKMVEMYPGLFDETKFLNIYFPFPNPDTGDTDGDDSSVPTIASNKALRLNDKQKAIEEENEKRLAKEKANRFSVFRQESDQEVKQTLNSMFGVMGMIPVPQPEPDAASASAKSPISLPRISLSMLVYYFNEIKKRFEANGSEAFQKYIYNVLQTAPNEEITVDDLASLIGVGDEENENSLDALIMTRAKIIPDAVDTLLVLANTTGKDLSHISAAIYGYLSNEKKETLIGTENVSFKDFVSALATSRDLGWVLKMLKKVSNGEIHFGASKEVNRNEWQYFLSGLACKDVVSLMEAQLNGNLPPVFDYGTLMFLTKDKFFTEDDLCKTFKLFKDAGFYLWLKEQARKNNYEKLKQLL